MTLVVLAGARRRSAFDEGANVAILEPALAEERREGKKEREEREAGRGWEGVVPSWMVELKSPRGTRIKSGDRVQREECWSLKLYP